MKKLLVVLAVLFASVAAYATPTGAPDDPVTGQASITVDVLCPITVQADKDLDYRVIAGTTYTAGADDFIEFTISGCTWSVDDVVETEINITYNLEAAVSNPDETEVTILGDWTIDGSTFPSPKNNYAFDGETLVKYTLTSVTATTSAVLTGNYVWNLAVAAEYSAL